VFLEKGSASAMTEISTRTLARLVGVAERTVREIATKGIFVRVGAGFDHEASVRNYCAHLRREKTGKRGEGVAVRSDERRRLARLQADALEMKIGRERGALVDAGETERVLASIAIKARDAILRSPARIASQLPHLSRSDVAVVDAVLRQALTELGGAK
jgi:phage terminase Nu1 subunit (DNA packaging protein)